MSRNSFKLRKSLGRGQKQNAPEILNNGQKQPSFPTLPSLHFPCATINLRPDPKKSKKLPLLDTQKNRTSRSTQHLSNALKLAPTSFAPSTKSSMKLFPPEPPCQQEISELENKRIVREYAGDYLELLLFQDNPFEPLENHNIKTSMRSKMVDWMVEVLCSYKCSDKTFFQAVELMDNYYRRTERVEDSRDLHLIGVTCMFMVIKLEEIVPLRLQTVYEKIGHKKLSMDVIKNKEEEILSALDFNILLPNIYDITTVTLQLLVNQYKSKITEKELDQILEYCVYISRLIMIEYDIITAYPKQMLSASVILLAFKIYKEVNGDFEIEKEILTMLSILNATKEEVKECSTRVLDLVKNFEGYYPSLGNVKKFSKLGCLGKKSSLF